MIENIQVRDGDMVTLAKVVNSNTRNLDSRINNLVKDCNRVFSLVETDMSALDKRIRSNSKQVSKIALCLFGVDLILLSYVVKMKAIEKKIQKLEDAKVVDDFLKEDTEKEKESTDFDFLK